MQARVEPRLAFALENTLAMTAATAELDSKLLLRSLRAFRKGDFTVRMPLDLTGVAGEVAEAFNDVAELTQGLARELDRVAQAVGKEGRIRERAQLAGSGGWAHCIEAANGLVGDLVQPTTEVARVIGAVAKGDLGQTMRLDIEGRPLRGEFLRIGEVVNTMVGQLGSFASEVTRVAREVGSEGKLGGQAEVVGVAGTWKDLTENVNLMAANLTGQVRNIAEVTTAVANGDLSKKITVDVKGEILDLKSTVNTMVDQLNSFASEVVRVAREVGSDGKLGGQAQVKGVGGVWADLTDNVNTMAENLTGQVRNIAEVTTAVAKGDLSKKITVDAKGEILELKSTVNTMVDQLNSFASEVTRVAREVGSEGKLGGQAHVEGVAGTWKGLTDNVNMMAANLTGQVRNIAEVTTAVANGDLSKKITVAVEGEILELKSTVNTMVDQLNSFASEVVRVAREVGSDGKLGGQAQVKGVGGVWADLTDNVNTMAENLTGQVRNIAEVTTAVAKGDLSKKITVDAKGEILELKSTVNTMVDQLNSFASEVTRVAREVGSDGKLGGQAQVRGVAGTWKDLTDNVNMMAANLTGQVRGLASVVTAVARGDLKRKFTVDAKGEIADLADIVNEMIDTLAVFADQVTDVAREVGVEGKLGGQARVPGAAGLWRDLTDNVNQLAQNLTTQVRAIAEVATAVTKGDLARSIAVEASGEVAALKDTINEMIRNLRDTTRKNAEQDWLKTNLAKFTRMLQGERDMATVSDLILSEIAPLVNAQRGVFYLVEHDGEGPVLDLVASYAFTERKSLSNRFRLRQGLVGQCAYEKKRILLTSAPADYITIGSGLGEAPPLSIIVLPVLFEGEVKAVIELASFGRFSETHQSFLDQLTESIGIVLNTIAANMQTADLLKQSQLLTAELQTQQEELKTTNDRLELQATSLRRSEDLLRTQRERLQQTNEELEEKARLLEIQKGEVEGKNREVSVAKTALEEKAEQLSLTSRYKSQFLANMSHELRTPLNSLLILSKLLIENPEGNLSTRQREFARTINAAGTDLLSLINDILDLSKIESGTVTLDLGAVALADTVAQMERTFRQVADERGLAFTVAVDPALPAALHTDSKRLQQVLRNLLANAFKFTEAGGVTLRLGPSGEAAGPGFVAFAVTDTGVGIPADKQRIIFEAFQQADGTTSRKYGGTGLGLAISREIARLLGGEITVSSRAGAGSTFTLLLPAEAPAADGRAAPAGPRAAGPAHPSAIPVPTAALDDRHALGSDDHVVLVVEDDAVFASVLLDLARECGFKALVAPDGAAAVAMAHRYRPHAITLDIGLPDMDGWALLDLFKNDPRTRHVPVHVISVSDDRKRGLKAGAFGFLEKPVDRGGLLDALARSKALIARPVRKVLLVEDDEAQRAAVAALLDDGEVRVVGVGTAEGALRALGAGQFDCVIADLGLPDMPGADLIDRIRASKGGADLPVVVYTGRELSPPEAARLERTASTIVVKDPDAPRRLLDETALFLHRAIGAVPPERQIRVAAEPSAAEPSAREAALEGRKVLLVDDDLRNIFSLTSALESFGLDVLFAESGREGLDLLDATPGIDALLVDIMMPDMDGYETMKAVRGRPAFRGLPIIAVTAKAMVGDREKCLEAGASDYVSKPVDLDQLMAVLRVQLDHRGPEGIAGGGLAS